ncbi:Ig-like domain-containing protein [Solicola gregarius]|uniref:Ig-like domain-containing protein n=1 Tax=Solicola gregarius TaxID=2908642 RepID=A0AA46YN80_9ACTN|nr:Ig-like domain-containing protein [Solicola gregarius]UYM07211.1 Ig-like domain-containing protein [Solicola gregarius]
MPSTSVRARRTVAIGASSALVAGAALAMTAATTTSADAAKINKNTDYNCVLSLTGDSYPVGVTTKVTVPKSVAPGQKVPKRKTTLTLNISEELHETVLSLGGTDAEGGSKNAKVGVKVGKKTLSVPINKLSAPKAPIPPSGEKWSIDTAGTVGAFKVPATAKGGTKAKLSMPKKFTIDAIVYLGDTAVPNELQCTADGKRALGSIAIKKAPSKLKANVKPKKVVAKKTRAKVNVSVRSTGKATGKVRVMEGKKTLGAAAVKKGKATVTLKKFAKPGKHKLTIKYAGNKSVKASMVKRTIKVVRK